MRTLGYLIYREGDGLMGFRRTETEAKEFAVSCEDIDPDSIFVIKEWTQEVC